MLPLGAETEPGRVFFQSSQLSLDTPHTLKVSPIDVADDSVPLSLQSLIIGNGTIPPSISSVASSSTQPASAKPSNSSSTPTTQTMDTHGIHRQILAGPVAGSLVGTLLILGFIIFVLRRRRRNRPIIPDTHCPAIQRNSSNIPFESPAVSICNSTRRKGTSYIASSHSEHCFHVPSIKC